MDFPSDENCVSGDHTIFIFHIWSYQRFHDYFSLSQLEITTTSSHFSINYLKVLKDNYIAFFLWNFMSYCYNIQNTDKRYLFSQFQTMRKIFFYLLPIGWFNEKSVILVFHRCLHNKQNITCPLVLRISIFSCSSRCFTCSLRSVDVDLNTRS